MEGKGETCSSKFILNLALLWQPPRMPLSLAHEDISEENGKAWMILEGVYCTRW